MAVATSGYPFGTPNLITSTGYIASAWAVELDEVPDPLGRGTRLRGVADSYLADMHINGGNSGGPVYRTAEGAVIGVCVATRGAESWLPGGDPAMTPDGPVLHNSGIASVVPAAYVRDLLAHAGSTWTPA
jgi:S1-C subfamily serine protease